MSNQINDTGYISGLEQQETVADNSQFLQQLIYRILPFWPLIAIALFAGFAGGYLFLRYATPLYQAKSRIVVNDNTEEKSANLQAILNIDTRDLSDETEKEIEILRSIDLLKIVASELQLNVQYFGKGKIKTKQVYDYTPVKLELQTPDSVKNIISGAVKIIDNKVQFNGVLYPVDSFISTPIGEVKWHINEKYKPLKAEGTWMVSVLPVLNVAKQLKVALSIVPISKKSSIVDVTFTDLFKERSVLVLNTLINIYGKSTVDYKSRIYENSKRFLDGRLNIVAEELSGVEKDLQNYKTTEHIVDLGFEGNLYLNKLKVADTKIGEIEVQLDVIKEIEGYVIKRNSTNNQVPATLGITDPVLNALLNQLFQAEFELDKIKKLSGEKNPQVEVLEQIISKLRPSILSSINNLRLSMEASRKSLKTDNENLNVYINKIPQKERLLLEISRQQSIKNAIYTYLLQKREESAIAAASVLPNYRIIEKPELVGLISLDRMNYYLIGMGIGLLVAAVFIYFKEFANSRLQFKTQIESSLPLIPILGELIYNPSETGSPVVVGEGKRTLIAEQFRELRTNLNYITANSSSKCKIILVTSSIPSEGKSFVAINSSVSLSLTGARVLLMEFDLRKPKISKPLGISREIGITNYLIGNASEREIIQQHPSIPNFYITASGPVPPNPAELIGLAKLDKLMTSLKEKFDYIIIDTPPVAAVTDAKLLARFADVTLYIVRYNFTNKGFLNLINDTYQRKAIPNINIVFNGIVNKQVLGYGKGYGYGYGTGYGYGYAYGYGYTVEDKVKKKTWWEKGLKILKIS